MSVCRAQHRLGKISVGQRSRWGEALRWGEDPTSQSLRRGKSQGMTRLSAGPRQSEAAAGLGTRRRLSSQHFSAPDLSRSVDVPPQKTHRGQNRIALTPSLSVVFAKPKRKLWHSKLSAIHSSQPSHYFRYRRLGWPRTRSGSLEKS